MSATCRRTRCALPFGEGEFDVYFSNAVIEHVGGPGAAARSSDEALRVGRRVFVTDLLQRRWFPLELHTRLPLVHWLPEGAAHPTYDLTGGSRGRRRITCSGPVSSERLFHGRARIVNLGMTLVAIVD